MWWLFSCPEFRVTTRQFATIVENGAYFLAASASCSETPKFHLRKMSGVTLVGQSEGRPGGNKIEGVKRQEKRQAAIEEVEEGRAKDWRKKNGR